MSMTRFLAAVAAAALALAQATAPETPAGRQLSRWLEVFNRGNSAEMKEFRQKNFGPAERDATRPNRLDTQIRLGSMNKMFTAVAIMTLVEAGKVKLADPVGKFLPDYPNADVRTKVTVHQLLTHTGGTGDFFGPKFEANRENLRELGDYV